MPGPPISYSSGKSWTYHHSLTTSLTAETSLFLTTYSPTFLPHDSYYGTGATFGLCCLAFACFSKSSSFLPHKYMRSLATAPYMLSIRSFLAHPPPGCWERLSPQIQTLPSDVQPTGRKRQTFLRILLHAPHIPKGVRSSFF